MGKYNPESVVHEISKKHGRVASKRHVHRRLRALFGSTEITHAQKEEFLQKLALHRLGLNGKTKRAINTALKRNQRVPPPQRQTHTQIAIEYGTVAAPINIDLIRKMNRTVKAEMASHGEKVSRVIATDPARAEVPDKVRKAIQENLNITYPELLRKLKLSVKQFAIIMQQFGLKFRRMKFEERKRAIDTFAFVKKPGTIREYTNEEIARKLGFSKKYIEENRPRRGKSSGTKAQIESVVREVIIWVDFITKPKHGQISFSQLLELTGANPFTLSTALKTLKKGRALIEVNTSNGGLTFIPTKGERYFFIGSNGVAVRNAMGARVRTNRATDFLNLNQLEKIHDQLSFINIHGTFNVSQRMLNLVREARDRKRLEEYNKKNKR